jgi:hypothetical protein
MASAEVSGAGNQYEVCPFLTLLASPRATKYHGDEAKQYRFPWLALTS